MILCPRDQREHYYTTFLLAVGKSAVPVTGSTDRDRAYIATEVGAFTEQWMKLFGPRTDDPKTWSLRMPTSTDFCDTWVDYLHWLDEQQFMQRLQDGLPTGLFLKEGEHETE